MSIIHEALKKAGQEKEILNSQTSSLENARRNLEVEYQRKKPISSWKPFFGFLAVLVVAGPALAVFLATPKQQSALIVHPQNIQLAGSDQGSAENRKAQFNVEEAPVFKPILPQALSQPNLNLSGVVYSPTAESYCIINGKIVKIGEEVDGAKLVSVSMNEASLEYKGEKVSLAVGD